MLDAFIIEEIRRREQERESHRPSPQLPIPEPSRPAQEGGGAQGSRLAGAPGFSRPPAVQGMSTSKTDVDTRRGFLRLADFRPALLDFGCAPGAAFPRYSLRLDHPVDEDLRSLHADD